MYHFSFSFYYLISNIGSKQASVKTPGEINIADFCRFSVEELTRALPVPKPNSTRHLKNG